MHSLKLLLPVLLGSLASAATVQLGNTTIIGEDITSQGVEFFGGIPFTEPPIGNLRLRPPVLKTSLDNATFNATSFGASCLQVPILGFPSPANVAEDCLGINVIRPAGLTSDDELLPVMVYIYGGGFIGDTPSNLNATPIVARSIKRGTPVIYASFNYRLGPLGFPAGAEAAEKGALNLGLKDQLAALEWIQKNIALFGGDKDKVTLFGISAGSISTSIHLFNAQIGNYARAAILESGVAGTTMTFDATRRQSNWNDFVAALPECKDSAENDTFDCLRRDNISTSHLIEAIGTTLNEANEQFPWVPTLDGPGGVFPELPSELLKKGQYSRLPFIAGNCLDEGTLFTLPTGIADETTLRQALLTNLTVSPGSSSYELENAVDTLLEIYPDVPALGSPYNTGNETFGLSTEYKRLSSISGDLMFQFPRRFWTQAFAKAGVKAYGYQLSYPEMNPAPALGVSHGSDVPYVFGFAYPPSFVPSPAAAEFSEQVIDYWVSFATSLDPNDGLGSERPVWPQYTIDNPTLLQLNGSETGPLAVSVVPND
ncbi:hypothetical protein VNI00_009302 [Paramarasmius palmivorus]|uniref:Carboxylic ester hydrolase n=1 Tax=Paramarasmius palmivorus TaxID=297713 RepID=A0AAW0CSL7_9AGAR